MTESKEEWKKKREKSEDRSSKLQKSDGKRGSLEGLSRWAREASADQRMKQTDRAACEQGSRESGKFETTGHEGATLLPQMLQADRLL